jgi:hypothetical protein
MTRSPCAVCMPQPMFRMCHRYVGAVLCAFVASSCARGARTGPFGASQGKDATQPSPPRRAAVGSWSKQACVTSDRGIKQRVRLGAKSSRDVGSRERRPPDSHDARGVGRWQERAGQSRVGTRNMLSQQAAKCPALRRAEHVAPWNRSPRGCSAAAGAQCSPNCTACGDNNNTTTSRECFRRPRIYRG